MTVAEIRERLFSLQDTGYRDFQAPLIPTVQKKSIIGCRTPALRAFAKELCASGMLDAQGILDEPISDAQSAGGFLQDLPHAYFDENQLHAFIISREKDFTKCLRYTELFLPYIDNWATCDQLSPAVFKQHHAELYPCILHWLSSTHTYTVRFAIGLLLSHFLDDDFSQKQMELVACIHSDEYYIKMMIAWYFATALSKQYETALPFLQSLRLETWTHNKTIQKAIESRRISDAQKTYLKSLKIR